MRSDCFHCGVPAMDEEPTVEFIGIENSRMTAFADYEEVRLASGVVT